MTSKDLLEALKPLFFISKITGTEHVTFNENVCKPKDLDFSQKVYNVIIAIVMGGVSMWSLVGKCLYAYKFQLPVMIVLNVLFHISLTLGTILQSILPLLTKASLVTVIENIIEANEVIELRCHKHNRHLKLAARGLFLLIHLLAGIFILFDMTVWITSYGFDIAKYYIIDALMLYKLTLHSSQLFICLTLLRERFKFLNKLLPLSAKHECFEIQSSASSRNSDAKIVKSDKFGTDINIKKAPAVRELSRVHDKLYRSCIEMNQFFGALIVILCFEVFIMMTQSVYSGVVYGAGLQKTLSTNFNPVLGVAVMICWTFYSFVLVVMLTSLCEYTVNAANESGIIAHKILLEDGLNEQTMVDLTRVATKIQQQNLKFTACGLFGINLTTLLQLLGAVSSYIIVAFQFEGMSPTDVAHNNIYKNATR